MKIVIKNLVACSFVFGLLFVGGAGASAYGGSGADSMDGCTSCHNTPVEDGDNIGNNVPNTPAAKPPGHEAYTPEQCIGCHADQGGTNHAANDNCAGCHTEQAEGEAPPPPPAKPYGHENYTNDDCAGCHTGYDTNHYGSNCLGCHTETSTTPPPAPPNHYTDTHMGGFENNVGADNAEGGSCDSCHNVHMSEDSEYLTRDVNENNKSEDSETCMPCHSDKINSGHPTSGCASCHDIHGSTGEDTNAACLSCHTGYDTEHMGTAECSKCHQ